MTTPVFSACLALFRPLNPIGSFHQLEKVDTGRTARLSRSLGNPYLGEVFDNFWMNVKRSIRARDFRSSPSAASGSVRKLYPSPSSEPIRTNFPLILTPLPQTSSVRLSLYRLQNLGFEVDNVPAVQYRPAADDLALTMPVSSRSHERVSVSAKNVGVQLPIQAGLTSGMFDPADNRGQVGEFMG